MAKKFHVLASVLALSVSVTALSACGGNNNGGSAAPSGSASSSASASAGASTEKDTITMLLPPVSANYQSKFDQMAADFNALYPNLTLKIEPAGWEDITQKLDTQVNAGSPPDIAFIGSDGISKYMDQGMLMDITDSVTPEMLADYDEAPLNYMKRGDGLYGFPAYMSIQSIGGNKEMLEAAGVDWKNVQQNGWTFEEFRDAIKKGTVTEGGKTRYGFVFAVSGVTAKDYLNIMIKNAGMPAAFTQDLKFAYTSKNYLEVLKGIRQLIDDGSMPKELSSIDAGKRWNMFLTGQTMITGKGLATFENSAKQNNAKLEAKDASAVADSIPVEYVVLPMPTFAGQPPVSQAAVDGYVTFRGKKEPTPEHKANVVKAAYFMASGKVMAETNSELFVGQITKSAKEAAASLGGDRDPDNMAAVDVLQAHAAPARPDIPADLGAKVIKLEDEVIVPKFQALLAGETTPEEMYEAVKKAAIEEFGADGVVQD
ncbi:extracellular solute-binding protein [Cohnella lubricantis]|uniref:Extracellular solute-binding protein n=1 Tax=Cohnella lubricantis TaxID=2163172 RepID=A0A841TB52_9BACL|nr:extracellular solute-binding protein [Cohnella lubricantis]MBB6678703.1 extracellular solute-binding protein [Cohnella lubricantis]MBP2118547.1 multiple sugar transport system substrate-binding protein [Cohnella lubricantis]